MNAIKNTDYFKVTVLVSIAHSLVFMQTLGTVALLIVWLVRDEVLRPYFYKKEATPLDISIVQLSLDNLKREVNAIKLDKAIRSFND